MGASAWPASGGCSHVDASGALRGAAARTAAAAGVTPNALYHYFASKADLFAAAHEAALRAFQALLRGELLSRAAPVRN